MRSAYDGPVGEGARGQARRSYRAAAGRRWMGLSAMAMAVWAALPSGGRADVTGLQVVATIKPIHALVAGVMDGIGSPVLLVEGTASPHTFALKPSAARALNEAAVVFRVSAAVEPFTVKIVATLPKSTRIVTLAEAPGVHELPMRTGSTFEAHEHDDGHNHAGDAGNDGHVWLDPANAKAMVREIARILAEAAPDHGARFAANAERVLYGIDALDQEIRTALGPVRHRPYIVFHDAYQYFERTYGLSPVAAITLRPESQPGAKRLSEIRRRATELGAACVFAEPQFSSNVMRSVTDDTTMRFGTLDPEGALVEQGPEAYGALMRNLAHSLRDCLAGPDGKG